MKKNAKIALAMFAVLSGVSASFISYSLSEVFFNPGMGIPSQISGFQHTRNAILPFLCITLMLIIPTMIPPRYPKALKVTRIFIAVLAFIISFLASFIAVPESMTIWYSIDLPAKLPMYAAEVIVMLGTFSAAVVLLWPEVSGKLLTIGGRRSAR
jgi:hypothetical protein